MPTIMGVMLIAGLVAVFWIQVALVVGLKARAYMAGAISAVLRAMIIFFIGGGLAMVRANKDAVTWIAWLFPNTYAVDPLRDLVLFNTWPLDFWPVLWKLLAFAGFALIIGNGFAVRKLRRID